MITGKDQYHREKCKITISDRKQWLAGVGRTGTVEKKEPEATFKGYCYIYYLVCFINIYIHMSEFIKVRTSGAFYCMSIVP